MATKNQNTAHVISWAQAAEMTLRFRNNRNSILKPEYSGLDILPLSETFSKDAFNAFFNNVNCKSIRIYYGMSSDLKIHAIIVGADDQNADILPGNNNLQQGISNITDETDDDEDDDDDGTILEDSFRCPASCPPASPLNEP